MGTERYFFVRGGFYIRNATYPGRLQFSCLGGGGGFSRNKDGEKRYYVHCQYCGECVGLGHTFPEMLELLKDFDGGIPFLHGICASLFILAHSDGRVCVEKVVNPPHTNRGVTQARRKK